MYVDSGTITIWINKNGNAWSSPITINDAPVITDSDDVRLSDLHGTGLSSLLYSGTSPDWDRISPSYDSSTPLKPYLLTAMDNHIRSRHQDPLQVVCTVLLERIKPIRLRHGVPCSRFRFRLFPVWKSSMNYHGERKRHSISTMTDIGMGSTESFGALGMVEQYDSESFDEYDQRLAWQWSVVLKGSRESVFFADPHQDMVPPGLVGDDDEVQDKAERAAGYWTGDPSLLEQEKRIKNIWFRLSSRRSGMPYRTLRGACSERNSCPGRVGNARRAYTVTESQYELREIEPPGADNGERSRIFYPHVTATRTHSGNAGTIR